MTKYAKAVVALLGALATWGVTAAEDGVYTQVELWGALLAVSTAAAVWFIPNKPTDERGESTLATVCVALIALVVVLWALGADLPASVL